MAAAILPRPPPALTPASEWPGAFSPDGRYVTYFSIESGRWEVYVIPFPGADRKWRVSTGGAVYPEWRTDGRGIVYQELGGRLVVARVETGAEDFRVLAEEPLFDLPAPEAGVVFWTLAPDGERVLVVSTPEGAEPRSSLISLVVNWPRELAEVGPRGRVTETGC